jgi:thioredoxin-related protein
MASLKGIASGTTSKKLLKMVIGVVVVVVLISIGLYAYHAYALRGVKREGFKEMGSGCADARYTLIFFYMQQCPHCVSFRPEWDKCAKTVDGGKFGKNVCLREYSADVREMSTKYKVDGYPTVILEDTKTDKRTVYDGPRTMAGLIDFIGMQTA